MNKLLIFALVLSLAACLSSPVFSEDKPADRPVDLKLEIAKQEQINREGADTFWSGVIVAGVGYSVLIPVYYLLKDKNDDTGVIVSIAAGAVALPAAICMIWGGTQWLLTTGEIDRLKKELKDVSLVPYIDPLSQNSPDFGLGINLKL